MPVRVLDMSLGRANPPDAILHQRVETAALQAIQMQREVCGKGTCTFLYGGNAVPLINMK